MALPHRCDGCHFDNDGHPFYLRSFGRDYSFCYQIDARSIMQTIGVYSGWYQQRGTSQRDISTELARKFLIKNMLNLTIVTAVLIVAAVSNHGIKNYLGDYRIAQPLFQNITWLLAFVFCVPFLLLRKRIMQPLHI